MADEIPEPIRAMMAVSKCEYRRLGKSGLKVTVPILGAMSFGDPRWADWVISEEEGMPLLKAAWDRGLTTWDTANVYSAGHSEICIGKALKKYDIPRHRVEILTKCYATVPEDPGMPTMKFADKVKQSRDYSNQQGLSRAAIFNAVDASLKRLQTDYIDLLQIHRFDKDTPIEETMEALHDLIKSGKVRYIGASSMWTYQFAMMQFCAEKNGWTKFVSMQNQYNLLYREEEREMNKFCNETGVGLIPWGPLARGHLARPPSAFGETKRSAQEKKVGGRNTGVSLDIDAKIIGRVQEIAEKRGWKMSTVTLAWINKRVTSPIIGFSTTERMDEAIEASGKVLDEEETNYLEELYEPKTINGHQ